jgi:pyrroline-5-carboxylate reductase
MHITFIGGGNMASALIGGLSRNGWHAERMRVADIDAAARDRVAREFGIAVYDNASAAVANADCIVLAVKPQHLQAAARELAAHVSGKLVLSIAAGIRVRDIRRWLGGHSRIVRAMPNTPALVLSGITGLYADEDVGAADRQTAEEVLRVAGATLWVDTEADIDAITAVSGSGPAYVFYFLEALESAARKLGFDDKAARQLAFETFSGAVRLARESTVDFATLRARVTSKGGTTERALGMFEQAQVRAAIERAVQGAAERSREMADELGADEPGSN